MLSFSKRQISGVEAASQAQFLRETLALHRRDCPGLVEDQTDDHALDILGDCSQTARDFGFTTEALIRRFLVIQAVAGRYFYEDPSLAEAHPFVEGDATDAHTRMMRIEVAVLEVLNPEPDEDDPFG
ncbi:MAG: hypothetical protein AB8B85_00835 [Paracoccaceae bacterium]